jgi:hypothetical protein
MGNRASRLAETDYDDEERAFLRLLAAYGEPAPIEPPPDLVTRMGRRLSGDVAAQLARRRRVVQVLQWAAFGAVVVLLALGAWVVATGGPAAPLIGNGTSGVGRALLTVQLILKPLIGTFGALLIPLTTIGGVAACASAWLIRRRPVTADASSHLI